MCKHGITTPVKLCQPRTYSRRTEVQVDSCIAELVQKLNDLGVRTMNSCCGHGKDEGGIFYEQNGKIEKIVWGNKK